MNTSEAKAEPLKGLVAGAVGGLAGAYAMNLFQSQVMPRIKEAAKSDAQKEKEAREKAKEASSGDGESSKPATVVAADKLAKNVLHRELTEEEEKKGGPLMHYAMGVVSGAVLGVAAEYAPVTTLGHGAGFGTAVWGIADEIVVPATGLSKAPTEYPISTHAEALAAHIVYGVTTETVREGVRGML